MKKTAIFCALVAAMMGATTMCASTNHQSPAACSTTCECEQENNGPIDGMFFTSDSVMEIYDEDEGVCGITYTDLDANMDWAKIYVDMKSGDTICEALRTDKTLTGTLVLNEELSNSTYSVFTLIIDND